MKFGTILRLGEPSLASSQFGKLKKAGYNCCHLVYKPDVYNKNDAEIIYSSANEQGIEISTFFAGYKDTFTKWNLYSDFEDAGINSKKYGRERIEYVKQAAVFCKDLGTKNVLIHAGFIPNNPFGDDYKYAVEVVRELSEYLKELDLNLILETGGESPISLLRLINDVATGNIRVNIDTGNIVMYGFGNPVDAVYTLNSYISSIHIKDGLPPEDPKILGKETNFGEGFVDFNRFFSALKHYGFDGSVIIEREINDGMTDAMNDITLSKLKQMI